MSLLSECLDKDELKNHQFEQEGVEGMMGNMTLNDRSSIEENIDALKEIKTENLSECLNPSYMSSKIDKSISMIINILEGKKLFILAKKFTYLPVCDDCVVTNGNWWSMLHDFTLKIPQNREIFINKTLF